MKPVFKKVVALFLALLMCLSVAACAGGKTGSNRKQKQNTETITVTDMLHDRSVHVWCGCAFPCYVACR